MDLLDSRVWFGVFLFAGFVVGAGAVFVGLSGDQVSAQEAGENLVSTLEAQSGNSYSVLNTESSHGLYRVDIRNPDDQVETYYVTKDGSNVSQSLGSLERIRETANERNKLSNCLERKNVVMFGNISQRQTQAQIQLLGGQRYVSDIYADVNNEQVLQTAAQAGVQSVPSMVYNGSSIQGVNSVSRISNFTGCNLES
jgi:hypothetical protein